MDKVEALRTFEQIKSLSDSRRLNILRLLMAEPATLTQLGAALGQSPAWVRHHIKALEAANLVEIAETRTSGTITEKYYQARAGAFLLQEIILPQTGKSAAIISGSHDLALELLAARLAKHFTLLMSPVGSLDGLMNLRQGLCQLSGAHLLDESGEYNTPYVRRFFPDRPVEMVTLAYRTQGLLVAPGNPKGIKSLSDLSRADVTFLNRNPGSGTRLWLERELARIKLPASAIRGYERFVHTHTESARGILDGSADVSLGIQAAAHQNRLDFIPLFEERYDLVLPVEQQDHLAPLLDDLQTQSFRHAIEALTGYNTAHSGEQILL